MFLERSMGMGVLISADLEENRTRMEQMCRNCDDIILRPMTLGRMQPLSGLLVYIETAASNMIF